MAASGARAGAGRRFAQLLSGSAAGERCGQPVKPCSGAVGSGEVDVSGCAGVELESSWERWRVCRGGILQTHISKNRDVGHPACSETLNS